MLSFLLPSILAIAVHAYTNPMTCSGTCTNAHDPSLIRRDDGTYFRFSTGGKIAIHSAPAITGPWTYKGAAIPSGSSINKAGKDDLWVRIHRGDAWDAQAPDVQKVGSTYYLYYSVSSFGSQDSAIGVATSSSLDYGSWTDLGSTGISSSSGKSYNAIDGNLIYTGSDYYVTFGSFWGDLYQVKMANPPKKVASGSTSVNVAYIPSGSHAQEGGFVYKNGNYYYLFFSVGQCCGYDSSKPAAGGEYKIQVCRSSTVTGGYVDKSGNQCTAGGGTTVLESHDWVYGPGGQGVFTDPSLGPVLYYHYVDTRIGYADGQKQFGVNKLSFSSGWPVV
ncbi:endo-1,5-alpha-L-arabinosidase [Lindgomyces ingoldianus]|uniref:Endo-1,5-alpha-L-arabinosidase n=1 Tax=Lindgomyces ingoldianus TaxID=673940 RepID=A0ACB6RC96_9PLEO|nr:endo-1,5-alpha-L-arabinosidase [Lindgomyces ingoldianus]KAF2476670.1 endo-1,5-alpha-L-arabinosidase [Lindgomyces ingoldianus]